MSLTDAQVVGDAVGNAPADGTARKLCILTQYFPPEMGAPQARLSELGENLIDLGWQVEVLTALPNYPKGVVDPAYDPREVCVETIGRMRTVRVPLYTAKSGFLKRLRCYFSFVGSAKRYGPQHCRRPDLLFVESPPLFIGYAARYLSKRWGCPYVLNISDLWPESAVRMGVVKPGVATWLAERLELSLYRGAAGVTGQSSGIIDSIKQRCPDTSTEVITNGVDPQRFSLKPDAESAELLGTEPGPIFVYAGLFGFAQGLDQILDLAKSLPVETPGRFVLIGDGPLREALQQRVDDEAITRVKILPAQPRERIPALLSAADVAIISLGMAIPGAVPSKIYEAMAASLPILLIAAGEPCERVARANCGIAVPPGDPDALRVAFQRLIENPSLRGELGANGRRAAETVYDRRSIAQRLNEFLAEMVRSA